MLDSQCWHANIKMRNNFLLVVISFSPPALAAADAVEHKRNAASTPSTVCQLAAGRRRGFVKYPHYRGKNMTVGVIF